jgi:hypothetical protein
MTDNGHIDDTPVGATGILDTEESLPLEEALPLKPIPPEENKEGEPTRLCDEVGCKLCDLQMAIVKAQSNLCEIKSHKALKAQLCADKATYFFGAPSDEALQEAEIWWQKQLKQASAELDAFLEEQGNKVHSPEVQALHGRWEDGSLLKAAEEQILALVKQTGVAAAPIWCRGSVVQYPLVRAFKEDGSAIEEIIGVGTVAIEFFIGKPGSDIPEVLKVAGKTRVNMPGRDELVDDL